MLNVRYSTQFKKDFKACAKRGYKMPLLQQAIDTLRIPAPLPVSNKDHKLIGDYSGYKECHIAKYAVQFELVPKDYSQFTKITKEEDDTQGVPFTQEELQKLWAHKDLPFVDTILIYCYSGWRINELARMPLENIDLQDCTFTGGLKNRYSRNRMVPIHPAIYEMVRRRFDCRFKSIIYHDGQCDISEEKYRQKGRISMKLYIHTKA